MLCWEVEAFFFFNAQFTMRKLLCKEIKGLKLGSCQQEKQGVLVFSKVQHPLELSIHNAVFRQGAMPHRECG